MLMYEVKHYHQNARHNTTHRFRSLKEAQEEFMQFSSDNKVTGVTYLEIVGEPSSWKKREWNKRRATATSGKFRRGKKATAG